MRALIRRPGPTGTTRGSELQVGHPRIERGAGSISESPGHQPVMTRAHGGIRILTEQGLKLPPLPIGLRSRLVRGERIELSSACL